MTENELIAFLRNIAEYGNVITEPDRSKLNMAADLLEVLDERVAIMEEGNGTCELSSQEN